MPNPRRSSAMSNPKMSNPRMSNPKMSNPRMSNPKMSNAKVSNRVIINPRRACTAGVTVLGLCVCVCVSVTQHLTFYVFIHATNNTNLLGGG